MPPISARGGGWGLRLIGGGGEGPQAIAWRGDRLGCPAGARWREPSLNRNAMPRPTASSALFLASPQGHLGLVVMKRWRQGLPRDRSARLRLRG